jgi:hypothetical protein
MGIYINGALNNSVALAGNTVSDNNAPWELFKNNGVPYMQSFKYSIGGVLTAWYQPVLIIGSSLADRTGNGYSADLEFGVNPDGMYPTVLAMAESTTYTSTGDSGDETPVVVGDPNLPVIEDVTATGETSVSTGGAMPQYDLINRGAEAYGISTTTMYGILMGFVAIVMLIGTAIATGSMMPGVMMGALTMAVGASTLIAPWWLAIFLLLFGVMVVYVLRRT